MRGRGVTSSKIMGWTKTEGAQKNCQRWQALPATPPLPLQIFFFKIDFDKFEPLRKLGWTYLIMTGVIIISIITIVYNKALS